MDNNVLGNALNIIAANVPKEKPGDYKGEDGLLYCGNCHTPKQCYVTMFEKVMTMPIVCKCRQAEIQEEEISSKLQKHKEKVKHLRELCFSTADSEKYYFTLDERSNPKISDAMKRYVDKWEIMKSENMGLLLYGNVGTGKSFYAGCIANALIEQEIPVLMTNFVQIINTLQGMYDGKQDYINEIVKYPLLILDDLGAERQSDYMLEQVYNIINARYQTGKPLIVTTNIPIEEIKEPQDIKYQRIYDRILEICHPIKIEGNSRRRKAVKDNYKNRMELLGL